MYVVYLLQNVSTLPSLDLCSYANLRNCITHAIWLVAYSRDGLAKRTGSTNLMASIPYTSVQLIGLLLATLWHGVCFKVQRWHAWQLTQSCCEKETSSLHFRVLPTEWVLRGLHTVRTNYDKCGSTYAHMCTMSTYGCSPLANHFKCILPRKQHATLQA